MSPAPKRPFQSSRPQSDRERTELRNQFLRVLDEETKGDATRRLERARDPFKKLARVLEEHGHVEHWRLSEIPVGLPSRAPLDDAEDSAWVGPQDPEGEPDERRYPEGWREWVSTSKGPIRPDGDPNPGHFSEELREDVLAEILEGLNPAIVDLSEPLETLREALHEWARPYHLDKDGWVSDHLCLALQTDRSLREAKGSQPFNIGDHVQFIGCDTPRVVRPPAYQPMMETRAGYLKRIGDYIETVEGLYRNSGWAPARAKPHLELHLVWLVRHHCLGRKYEDCDRANPSNIRKAIKSLRALLPLQKIRGSRCQGEK